MRRKSALRYLLYGFIILVVAIAGAVAYKIYDGHYNVWLYDYYFNQTARGEFEGIVDIVFVHIDHWEPGTKVPERNLEIINTWMREYRKLADKHIDSDGIMLQHTFFYPLEQFAGYQVDSLVRLCREGYGDVEVHLHHQNDTPESLRRLFCNGIDSLQAHGALISPDGQTRFAFVHGNWALDNSRLENGKNFCGVNSEMSILLELGCYADFTFPALNTTAQPSLANKIYYATDDPERPKSYDTGIQSRVGIKTTPEQLMIFQGPMMINWNDWRFGFHPTIDDGDIYRDMLPSVERFDLWVKADIHVLNGPDWVFVRPHTHGCSIGGGGIEANLGSAMDEMLTAVEKKYRAGGRYRLHYMTAREAYNVVRAAEDGMTGNPNDYRDYIIKPYLYVPQKSVGNLR